MDSVVYIMGLHVNLFGKMHVGHKFRLGTHFGNVFNLLFTMTVNSQTDFTKFVL